MQKWFSIGWFAFFEVKNKVHENLLTFSIISNNVFGKIYFPLIPVPLCDKYYKMKIYVNIWQNSSPRKYAVCVMAAFVSERIGLWLLIWNVDVTDSLPLSVKNNFYFLSFITITINKYKRLQNIKQNVLLSLRFKIKCVAISLFPWCNILVEELFLHWRLISSLHPFCVLYTSLSLIIILWKNGFWFM